jgi:hypothetical protein
MAFYVTQIWKLYFEEDSSIVLGFTAIIGTLALLGAAFIRRNE